jgi:hypothetical protein
MEFGLFMFHKVAIESITMQVGREASLNTSSGYSGCNGGSDRFAYIRCYVREKSGGLINGDLVEVSINTVANGGTRAPDICLATNPPSSPPTCNGQYEDINGNGSYDGPAASNNAGGEGELVEVRVSYPWQVLVPLVSQFIGTQREDGSRTGVVMITSSTVFRNEPGA